MEDILRRLEQEAESYRSVLSDLEAAIDSLRRVIVARGHAGPATTQISATTGHAPTALAGPGTTRSGPGNRDQDHRNPGEVGGPDPDLSRFSIKTAAALILQGAGKSAMHYKDIARKAIERGYRSASHGDDVEQIAFIFRDTMRRDRKAFDRDGASFRLRPGYEPEIIEKPDSSHKSVADYVAEIMAGNGGVAMRTADLITAIQDAGYGKDKNPKTIYSAVYSALDRSKDRFERDEAGRWMLKVGSADYPQSNGTPRDRE